MQLPLAIELPASRPLIPVECLVVLLDWSEEEVLSAVQSGGLPWAWDIRHPDAHRAEIRVWRQSVLDVLTSQSTQPMAQSAVLATLFPHSRDTLRSTELHRLFSCSQQHTSGLISSGCLVQSGTRTQIRGCNAFLRVTRPSVEQFLTARRYQ